MLAQNVTLSNKQEGKIQIWNKILILISANRRFRNRALDFFLTQIHFWLKKSLQYGDSRSRLSQIRRIFLSFEVYLAPVASSRGDFRLPCNLFTNPIARSQLVYLQFIQ